MGTTGWRAVLAWAVSPFFICHMGDETFFFCCGWWVFVWLLVLRFVWVCCFGSVFLFELSHSLLFTQKLWRFSSLSERTLGLLPGLCLGVLSVSRLFNRTAGILLEISCSLRGKKKLFYFLILLSAHPSLHCPVAQAALELKKHILLAIYCALDTMKWM